MATQIPGYKVYGSSAALSVELSMTRETERYPKGQHTISFEMAAFDGSKRADGADWANKLIVQVTPSELPQVIASLCGHGPSVEFKFHGSAKNKSYRIDNARPARLSMNGPGQSLQVTLAPHHCFEIAALGMRQLQRRHGSLSSDLIYRLLVDCHRDVNKKP